jgi:hypothetical protein
MAIETAEVQATNTSIYTSVDETALTLISLCNYSTAAHTITMHIVKDGTSPDNTNIFISNIEIVAGDTFIIYQGGEKILLSNNDYINVIADVSGAVTAITSYVKV